MIAVRSAVWSIDHSLNRCPDSFQGMAVMGQHMQQFRLRLAIPVQYLNNYLHLRTLTPNTLTLD